MAVNVPHHYFLPRNLITFFQNAYYSSLVHHFIRNMGFMQQMSLRVRPWCQPVDEKYRKAKRERLAYGNL